MLLIGMKLQRDYEVQKLVNSFQISYNKFLNAKGDLNRSPFAFKIN